jgi:hypothetical protein
MLVEHKSVSCTAMHICALHSRSVALIYPLYRFSDVPSYADYELCITYLDCTLYSTYNISRLTFTALNKKKLANININPVSDICAHCQKPTRALDALRCISNLLTFTILTSLTRLAEFHVCKRRAA